MATRRPAISTSLAPTGPVQMVSPRPEQAVMPTASPEEARLKKFYTEQYNVEADAFVRQPMSKSQFDQGIGQLQTKYKLAYNQAKMRIKPEEPDVTTQRLQAIAELEKGGKMSPEQVREARTRMDIGPTAASVLYREPEELDPAYVEWSKLDIYRSKLDERLKNYQWTQKKGKGVLKAWRPFRGEDGEWSKPKEVTPEEREEAVNMTLERNRIRVLQQEFIQPKVTSDVMRTYTKSSRMGGAIKDQVSNYLARRETTTQRQEPEEIIERGGKRWRVVGHDTDGTPLVEEVR